MTEAEKLAKLRLTWDEINNANNVYPATITQLRDPDDKIIKTIGVQMDSILDAQIKKVLETFYPVHLEALGDEDREKLRKSWYTSSEFPKYDILIQETSQETCKANEKQGQLFRLADPPTTDHQGEE